MDLEKIKGFLLLLLLVLLNLIIPGLMFVLTIALLVDPIATVYYNDNYQPYSLFGCLMQELGLSGSVDPQKHPELSRIADSLSQQLKTTLEDPQYSNVRDILETIYSLIVGVGGPYEGC